MENKIKIQASISLPTITRLPLYLSFLCTLDNDGNDYISAPQIGKKLHIDNTLITKDFAAINIKGKRKVGYNIAELILVIKEFLWVEKERKAFVVGIGNLGKSLLGHKKFQSQNLNIIAGFDINEEVGKTIEETKIYHLDNFKEIYKKTPVEIGIITVPEIYAQNIADLMVESGIKAIWNFSSIPITAPKNIIIENLSIDSGLAMILYKLNNNVSIIYKNRKL